MTKLPTPEIDLNKFSLGLNAETARGCGVLGAALLDAKLRSVFQRRLRESHKELLGSTGPLGSFGVRIRVARALAWISEDAHDDFDIIRDVANHFAHDHTLGFNDSWVSGSCAKLKWSQAFINDFDMHQGTASPEGIRAMQSVFTTPRWRYQLAVLYLAQYLDGLPGDSSEYSGLCADIFFK